MLTFWMLNVNFVGGCAGFRQALGRGTPPLGAPAGRPSGEGFINKVESGLVEAQHDMLVEKALYNRPVVISDGNGGVVEVSAKQLLN